MGGPPLTKGQDACETTPREGAPLAEHLERSSFQPGFCPSPSRRPSVSVPHQAKNFLKRLSVNPRPSSMCSFVVKPAVVSVSSLP